MQIARRLRSEQACVVLSGRGGVDGWRGMKMAGQVTGGRLHLLVQELDQIPRRRRRGCWHEKQDGGRKPGSPVHVGLAAFYPAQEAQDQPGFSGPQSALNPNRPRRRALESEPRNGIRLAESLGEASGMASPTHRSLDALGTRLRRRLDKGRTNVATEFSARVLHVWSRLAATLQLTGTAAGCEGCSKRHAGRRHSHKNIHLEALQDTTQEHQLVSGPHRWRSWTFLYVSSSPCHYIQDSASGKPVCCNWPAAAAPPPWPCSEGVFAKLWRRASNPNPEREERRNRSDVEQEGRTLDSVTRCLCCTAAAAARRNA
ncbi:hypothetical protein P154DRAFT_222714 [Amniculicola lignicola CBS 123094]|uniref:Uncharacterized protein n=1 Tax=Amniculicola lignicola CBS 123094 TaxID=1392246 RepID=A0A6A5X072_9PLEO|nr:hypothetical protein P154DRAFT_222714 [Amniculicola lignicola CBS 123094]